MCDSLPWGQHLLNLSDQKIGHSLSAFCLPVRASQASGHKLQGSRHLAVAFRAVFPRPKIILQGIRA